MYEHIQPLILNLLLQDSYDIIRLDPQTMAAVITSYFTNLRTGLHTSRCQSFVWSCENKTN